MRGVRAGLAMFAVMLCAGSAIANAATLTVTTTNDESTGGDGLCALREAIIAVDSPGTMNDCGTADDGANTIVLGAHTYALTLQQPHLIIGPPPTGCVDGVDHPNDNVHGNLVINANVHDLTIEGAGATQTVIDACELGDRAFNVFAGATVRIQDLEITNGAPPAGLDGGDATTEGQNGNDGLPGANGGGILNAGSLTLTDVTLTGNNASDGGGGGSAINATTGTVTGGSGGNGAIGGGGGGVYSSGTLTVTDSTISDNTAGDGGPGGQGAQGSGAAGSGGGGSGASAGGGAGIASTGDLTVTGTTINDNTAGRGGHGGGAASDAASSATTAGNGGAGGAGGDDGGIAALAGSLSITNSTITGNSAGPGGPGTSGGNGPGGDIVFGGNGAAGGGGGDGGGVGTAGLSSSALLNDTIADNGIGAAGSGGAGGNPSGTGGANGPKGRGGGLFALAIGAKDTLENSIFAANNSGGNCGTNAVSNTSVFIDAGHNLSPPTLTGLNSGPGCPATFGDGDPKLGPLQANLGPTETMALGAGSAAIDEVPATGSGCPATDQRGLKRPSGPACDIGAYEVTPPALSGPTATAIKPSGATLRDTVTANAISATVDFEFGPTNAYGSQTTVQTTTGLEPSTITATLSGLKPHTTYHYRVVATSPDGSTTSTDATFTTAQVAPTLTGLKVKVKHGKATVSYRDSLAAHTTLVLFAVERGVKHGGKCVAATTRVHGKGCSRLVKVKRVKHNDKRGPNSLRLSPKGLAAGRYRLEATASLDGAIGKTASKQFRVS